MFRKKRHSIIKISLSLVFSFLLMGTVSLLAETAKLPDTPAGKRAQEVINLLNSGTREKVKEFITNNFNQEFIKAAPMFYHLQVFSDTQDTYKGFEVKEVGKADDFQLQAVLWAPVTETWFDFRIMVEQDALNKIKGFRLTPGHAMRGASKTKKMTEQQMAETLKTYMEKMVKNDIFSGAVLLAKDGKVIFKGAYGQASKRFNVANRIDTKFNLGSMNKMFTAVAIAQLVEKGKMNYDDLVGKYLDGTWVQKETAEKVKIKHLLTHTSGLGSYFNQKFNESSRLRFRELEDYQPLIKGEKPQFEPGTKWRYSNTGMFLLGAIIQKVSNMDYFKYVRENIYKPAGMVNSDCFEMDKPVPNLAIGYVKKYDESGAFWRNNIYDHVIKGGPAGGGFSTVEDLLKFAQALKNNKLISKESLELLTTAKKDMNAPGYGYGFTVSERGDERLVGHSGGFTGIRSVLRMYMKSGYTIAVMSNYTSGMMPVKEKIESLITVN
jgi:CubicO group peptidase (beta-lactamase class C family)